VRVVDLILHLTSQDAALGRPPLSIPFYLYSHLRCFSSPLLSSPYPFLLSLPTSETQPGAGPATGVMHAATTTLRDTSISRTCIKDRVSWSTS
jgi:hypothetical protein